MCLLCVASRWSRRIAIMLPWLVMAICILWAASQLFPQAFFFEVHSPRLAWVGVLLISLAWYELVMPKVFAWRARRIAMVRQKRRAEQQEAARRRKKATRRCRNCYSAYKDQNPGSGRFMCTYCGHVSKRPVLDLPVGAPSSRSMFSLRVSAAEFFSGNPFFAVRSPLSWYGRGSLAMPSWVGGRRWIGNGLWIDGVSWGVSNSWFGGHWPGSALNFGNTGFGWTGSGTLMENVILGGERYASGDSYFGVSWFLIRVLSQLLVCALWLWRKLSRAAHTGEEEMASNYQSSQSRGADSNIPVETRSEKARRKAEEKRLARLEREYLEAEEQKQREEVARLVEERRRQRDKKLGKMGAERRTAIEASEEKQMEIRREEESERRQGKKVELSMKEHLMEQDTEMSNKRSSAKALKPNKQIASNEVEQEVKTGSKPCSKQGSAKSGFLLASKTATATKNNLASVSTHVDCSQKTNRGDTTYISSSSSTTSSSLVGNPIRSPGSSWSRVSWNNAWCKQASRVRDDVPKKLDMIENSVSTLPDDVVVDGICKHIVFDPNIGNPQHKSTGSTSTLNDLGESFFPSSSHFLLGNLPQDLSGRGHRMYDMEFNPSSQSVDSNPSMTLAFPNCEEIGISRTYSAFDHSTSSLVSSHTGSGWFESNGGKNVRDIPSLLHPFPCSVVDSSRNSPNEELSALLGNARMARSVLPNSLASTSANAKAPDQVWESWNVRENAMTSQETQDHGFSYQLDTHSPCNVPFQQGHDIIQSISSKVLSRNEEPGFLSYNALQTDEEPEFLLPSTLFSFEEINNDELSQKDSMGAQKHVQSGSCNWEDMDIYRIVPPEFVDCITHSLMEDPVITADGHSYERSAIEAWLKSHDTSPITGEVLPLVPGGSGSVVDKTLRPNHILRGQIMEYKERVSRFGFNHTLTNYGWTPAATAMRSGPWQIHGSTGAPPRGQYDSWTPGPVATSSSTFDTLAGCHGETSATTATKSYLWGANNNRMLGPFTRSYY